MFFVTDRLLQAVHKKFNWKSVSTGLPMPSRAIQKEV